MDAEMLRMVVAAVLIYVVAPFVGIVIVGLIMERKQKKRDQDIP